MPVCEPLLAWYDAVRRDLPWRHTRDPYRIWLSEIMLQQTRTETVKSYYNRFLALFPTVADLAHAPQEQVLKAWEGLGYYSRARHVFTHRVWEMQLWHFSLEDEPSPQALEACGGRMVSGEELRALPLPTAMRAAAQAAQALLQRPASPACNG